MGAITPEAIEAYDAMADDLPGLGLLVVTSPDLLHREWSARMAQGGAGPCHIESLLSQLPAGAQLVTMLDGSPGALSWLGGVDGRRVSPLGVDRFGQTGDLVDLYREYRLDPDAVIAAMAFISCSATSLCCRQKNIKCLKLVLRCISNPSSRM